MRRRRMRRRLVRSCSRSRGRSETARSGRSRAPPRPRGFTPASASSSSRSHPARAASSLCPTRSGTVFPPSQARFAILLGRLRFATRSESGRRSGPDVHRPGLRMRSCAVRSSPPPRTRGEGRGAAGVGERRAPGRRSDAGCRATAVWSGVRRRRKEPPGRAATPRATPAAQVGTARRPRCLSPRSREASPSGENPRRDREAGSPFLGLVPKIPESGRRGCTRGWDREREEVQAA